MPNKRLGWIKDPHDPNRQKKKKTKKTGERWTQTPMLCSIVVLMRFSP